MKSNWDKELFASPVDHNQKWLWNEAGAQQIFFTKGKYKNQATKFAFNLRGSFFFFSSFESNGVEIFLPRNFAASSKSQRNHDCMSTCEEEINMDFEFLILHGKEVQFFPVNKSTHSFNIMLATKINTGNTRVVSHFSAKMGRTFGNNHQTDFRKLIQLHQLMCMFS